MPGQDQKPNVYPSQEGSTLTLVISGHWKLGQAVPQWESLLYGISAERVKEIRFKTEKLGTWDTSLMLLLHKCSDFCRTHSIRIAEDTLPEQVRNLFQLSTSVPEKENDSKSDRSCHCIEHLGKRALAWWNDFQAMLGFTGELVYSFLALITFRSRMRMREFWAVVQQVGAEALTIVSLISFLVGIIIAFLGAVVLIRFRAEFAVSYLVGYGMLREMGAIMTGVIMAGRTGSAFAAQIGSMKVNEELDAMRTMGINPIDFIVLPRTLALILMMPLLTVYANLVGIFGGYLVSVWMLDIPSGQFFQDMTSVAGLPDLFLGILKGGVFGVLIAMSGCLRGLRCGNSADAVGQSTTQAVVLGITLIIFFNAIIDWIAAIFQI